MMPRRIRLFWTVGAVLAVLMVAGVAAAVLVPRLLPLGDEGSLYRRYRNMPGIEATYLKDFPVNDTLNVDVVLLVADTDAGWDTLHRDFNLTKVTPIVQQMIDQGRLRVLSRLSPERTPRCLSTEQIQITTSSFPKTLPNTQWHCSIPGTTLRTPQFWNIIIVILTKK